MEDFRSKSYGGDARNNNEVDMYYGVGGTNPTNGFQDMRCYSASYATNYHQQQNTQMPRELKKGKSANGVSSKAGWCFSDPELQRKKRVASYKSYSVEGKIKRSFTKSFRWLKDRIYK